MAVWANAGFLNWYLRTLFETLEIQIPIPVASPLCRGRRRSVQTEQLSEQFHNVWIPEGILLRHIPRKRQGDVVPPKPSELKGLPAVRPLVQCWGRNRGHSRDPGVVVDRWGKFVPLQGEDADDRLEPPAAPRRCPVHRLRRADREFSSRVPRIPTDGLCFEFVVERRGGTVGVHISERFERQPRIPNGRPHGTRRHPHPRGGRRHVIGISRRA